MHIRAAESIVLPPLELRAAASTHSAQPTLAKKLGAGLMFWDTSVHTYCLSLSGIHLHFESGSKRVRFRRTCLAVWSSLDPPPLPRDDQPDEGRFEPLVELDELEVESSPTPVIASSTEKVMFMPKQHRHGEASKKASAPHMKFAVELDFLRGPRPGSPELP